MLASQIIYTACGKTKKGDFETWSKSEDITYNEELEINEKMGYKRLDSSPRYPTQEEIDTIIPKMFSYFMLSSGRYCLAMSTYVGKVYSDEDGRAGNYVMHGFVFDKPQKFVPIDFFANEIFRQRFSYEEWHDSESPDSLQQIDIPSAVDGIPDYELRSFFSPEKRENLKLLVQAVINALPTDETITLIDDFRNLPYWYKGISLCLPETTQSSLTFNSFYIPRRSGVSAESVTVNTEVKIRSVFPENPGSPAFIYSEAVNEGKYAFDFENGVIQKNIKVSNFVDSIVDFIDGDLDMMKQIVEEVGRIGKKCNTDLDTALNLMFLFNKRIDLIDDIELIRTLIEIEKNYFPENVAESADVIYGYGILRGKWELSSRLNYIYDFITENATVVTKHEMVKRYLENLSSYGVREKASPLDFCFDVRANIPFGRWSYLEEYLLSDSGLSEYNEICGSSETKRFLVFKVYADALTSMKSNSEYKNKITSYVAREMHSAIKASTADNTDEIALRCEVLKRVEPTWPYIAIKTALQNAKNSSGKTLFDDIEKSFVLIIAEKFCDTNGAVKLIVDCAKYSRESNRFTTKFVARAKDNPDLYKLVENELKNDDSMDDFLRNVKFKVFEGSENPTLEDIDYYFRNCFLKGENELGIFRDKIIARIEKSQKKLNDCFGCMATWIAPFYNDDQLEIVRIQLEEIANKLRKIVYEVKPEAIKEYVEAHGIDNFKELNALCNEPFDLPTVYAVMDFYIDQIRPRTAPIKGKALDMANDFRSRKDELIRNDKAATDYLLNWYMADLMKIYLNIESLADAKNLADTQDLSEEKELKKLGYIFESVLLLKCNEDHYKNAFLTALRKLNADGTYTDPRYLRMIYSTVIYSGICHPDGVKVFRGILKEEIDAIPKKHVKFVMTKLLAFTDEGSKWKSVSHNGISYAQIVIDYVAELQREAKNNSFAGKIQNLLEKIKSGKKKDQKAEEKAKKAEEKAKAKQQKTEGVVNKYNSGFEDGGKSGKVQELDNKDSEEQ